jgi:Flp pilus assembly protein TadG
LLYDKIKNNRGQTIVETALSIIILFLVVFGITEFGRAMYIKNCLNNAARAGVRQAVVTPTLTGLPKTITSSAADGVPDIQSKIFNGIFYMNPANVTATVEDVNGNTTALSGDTIKVTVTLTGFTSFVPRLINIGSTLIGSASMRYE